MISALSARSLLFVPAHRPSLYAKALVSNADIVVVDLEDAVPPQEKDVARATLARWLESTGPAVQVMVRVNDAATPWFAADCDLVTRFPAIQSVLLPKAKADSPWDYFAGKPVIALMETATGIASVRSIAMSGAVARLAFGSLDLQFDLDCDDGDEALHYFRSELALASRLGDLPPPIDGVCTSLHDADALGAHLSRARRFGFGGQLCIHPAQVAGVNAGYLPTPDQRTWAKRIVAAAEASNGAPCTVDGKMVDRPILLRAHKLLQRSALFAN